MTIIQKLLLSLNKKYNGNWQQMYNAIKKKEIIDYLDKDIIQHHKFVCITDSNYPTILRQCHKPPFILFYEGNLSLLNQKETYIYFYDKCSSGMSKLINSPTKHFDVCSRIRNSCCKRLLNWFINAAKNKKIFNLYKFTCFLIFPSIIILKSELAEKEVCYVY